MMCATLSGRSPWIRCASAWRAWSKILGSAFLAFVLSLILVGAAHSAQTARQSLDGWIENGTQATIDQVSAAAAQRFKPVLPDAVHDLGPGKTLWLRLRLQADPGDRPEWGLDLPVPLLDFVTLYEKGPDGKWSAQRAGDTLAVASWSRPGRYASFDLNLPPGATREVFLQVRHRDPIGFELRIAPASALEQGRKIDYLPLGMILGTLLLLTAWCLIQAGIHRDPVYGWYGLYAAAMTLTMAAVTGVAGQLLWNQSSFWADRAQGVLPIALSGINILFLRHLCSLAARYPKVDRLSLAVGVLALLMAMAYPWVEGWASNAMVSFSLLSSLVLTFVLAGLAWRRGDPVGGWVLLAYAPLALTIVVVVVRLYGWITASWLTFDASAAASALAVPLLLGALHARSRDRHGVRTRVNKLTQQDALTGLLSATAFEEQLKGAVSGAIMRREAAAVVVVEVVNLQAIRQAYGDEMAEQCLLRAVIKLHRVVRDSDPAGRIAPGRFRLVLEGVRSRTELQERMVRLLTAGLTPARGAALDIPLQFHLACVLLSERVMTPALLLRDLDRLLASMSPRTRRPIRFLDPDDSRGPPRNNPTDGGAPAGTVSSQSGSSGRSQGRSSGPDSAGPGAIV
jgi:GGDEF domain-containing protein